MFQDIAMKILRMAWTRRARSSGIECDSSAMGQIESSSAAKFPMVASAEVESIHKTLQNVIGN